MKKNRYILPIRSEAPRGRLCTQFGIAVRVADIITSNRFFGDRSRDVDSVKIALSHSQSQSESTLTQGWRYTTQPVISWSWLFKQLDDVGLGLYSFLTNPHQ